MLLQTYPELRTRDLDAVGAAFKLKAFAGGANLSAARAGGEFVFRAANFKQAGLSRVGYDSSIMLEVEPSSDILIAYQLREVSEVLVDGEVIENGVIHPGCLIPSERPWSVQNPCGYQVLMLRVDTETLRRKQLALLGVDHARLELRQPRAAGASRALLRESVLTFARELDVVDRCFLPSLVVNAVDEICLGILTSLSEHYLEAGRPPAAPSHVQMERVEQYIAANYQRPLTVEALVEVSGVSARSVLRHFLPRHGYTLHDYLARIRLTMAQATLPAYRDEASVASVALRCGFSSVHQFVQAYRNRFGELPTVPLGERPPGRH